MYSYCHHSHLLHLVNSYPSLTFSQGKHGLFSHWKTCSRSRPLARTTPTRSGLKESKTFWEVTVGSLSAEATGTRRTRRSRYSATHAISTRLIFLSLFGLVVIPKFSPLPTRSVIQPGLHRGLPRAWRPDGYRPLRSALVQRRYVIAPQNDAYVPIRGNDPRHNDMMCLDDIGEPGADGMRLLRLRSGR